jgi:hypothetical protein
VAQAAETARAALKRAAGAAQAARAEREARERLLVDALVDGTVRGLRLRVRGGGGAALWPRWWRLLLRAVIEWRWG